MYEREMPCEANLLSAFALMIGGALGTGLPMALLIIWLCSWTLLALQNSRDNWVDQTAFSGLRDWAAPRPRMRSASPCRPRCSLKPTRWSN